MSNKYIMNENDIYDDSSMGNSLDNYENESSNYNSFFELDKMMIPKNNNFDYYKIVKGDTLYKIANDNNINPSLLAQLNGINEDDYIYPNQVLLVPKAGSILYITAIGDTLEEVSKGLKISIDDLMKQNSKIYLQPEQLIMYKYK